MKPFEGGGQGKGCDVYLAVFFLVMGWSEV